MPAGCPAVSPALQQGLHGKPGGRGQSWPCPGSAQTAPSAEGPVSIGSARAEQRPWPESGQEGFVLCSGRAE